VSLLLALLLGATGQLHGLRTRTPILTYHDVVERRDAKALWFDCTRAEFVQQLDWLTKRGAHFVSLDQLYDHLTTGRQLPSHAVVLTFADNYLGFYQRALPILRARHIPAAQFVHTGFVGSRIGRPKMNWKQLQELDREGLVTICSQTVTHPEDLRTLAETKLDQEIAGSKRELERRLGHPVRFLAYPNGKWDERSVAAARRAGYGMAFTEAVQPAERAPNLLAVPRYVHTKYKQAWQDAYGG
jgi:peptidoglycan/xylan/chitin deacetylase (PgdA/CDA1 family)